MSLDAQRSWMYSGWKDNGRHSDEWIRNTNAFVNHVFEGVRSFKFGVSCPCSKCCNGSRRTKQLMTSHLCHWGFMPNYFRWIALFFCIYYLLCRHWKDIPVVRKGRRPASVLTCLLKSNHPGILDYDGVKVIATEWEHNHAVKDTNGHSVAEKIEDVFWLRYKYEDAYLEKAKQHVRRCCKSLLPSIFYYARIQAIIDHFRKTENTSMNDKLAGQYYLDRAQYLAQRQGWLGKEAWIIVVDEWCSEEKSKKYRANHFSSKFKPHKGGSNSMTTISQKMSEETGEEVNQIQAWVHTHRGVDKSTPLILNTPEATKCLALYTEKTKELNGQDYDILKNDVSSKALYD